MKKRLIAFIAFVIIAAVSPARADKPAFTPTQFGAMIKCDQKITDSGDGLVKLGCAAQDLKTYPFLADLTKDPTSKGSIYQFKIARVEDKNLAKPILIVSMYNETIYTAWGSAATYVVNADGTYSPQWIFTNGTVAYTAECPKPFSFIIKGNDKNTYSAWVYDGKKLGRVAGYDKLEDFPACQ